MSLGKRGRQRRPVLSCMMYVHIFRSFPHLAQVLHVLLLWAGSHCCALLSVISWHGVFWQRNKPPWPVITPTANRYLCMGKAWLGLLIVLTPHVCVCVCEREMHSGFMACMSFCLLMKDIDQFPCKCVCVGLSTCVCLSIGSREPYGLWCQAGFF